MNDLLLPCDRKVEIRGVLKAGKTKDEFDVSVIVEGVCIVARVGEGGKTKRV